MNNSINDIGPSFALGQNTFETNLISTIQFIKYNFIYLIITITLCYHLIYNR